MGKRRNTAKTGDKALYKSRPGGGGTAAIDNNDDNDNDSRMYDEVDRYHNQKERNEEDFMKIGGDHHSDDHDDEDDEFDRVEAVMDLGAGGESSSSDDSDSDDDNDDVQISKKTRRRIASREKQEEDDGSSSSTSSSDDDDDDDDIMGEFDQDDVDVDVLRNWGKSKKAYYHGDTADLEIGQETDDAYLEEEAAKELQKSRYEQMSDDDFMLLDDGNDNEKEGEENDKTKDDDDDNDVEGGKSGTVQLLQQHSGKSLHTRKLATKKEKRKYLDQHHPELLPLVSYFADVVTDYNTSTSIATNALFYTTSNDDNTNNDNEEAATNAEQVGATKLGQQYLLTKELLQSTTALNLAAYLLLKSDQASQEDIDPTLIQSHPVIASLQKCNTLNQKLEDTVENKVDGLRTQLSNLVKAAALMKSEDNNNEWEDDGMESSGDDKDDEEIEVENKEESDGEEEEEAEADDKNRKETTMKQRNNNYVLNEARFGLRPSEIAAEDSGGRRQRQRRRQADGLLLDSGDGDPLLHQIDTTSKKTRALASTINSIEQRATVRQRRKVPLADDIDEIDDEDKYGGGRGGIDDMMAEDEDELGGLFSSKKKKGHHKSEGDDFDDGGEFDDDGDDIDDPFYAAVSKKSKSKKQAKKELYKVAPKFPRTDIEIDGERAINKTIMKNRGLVAHKSKLNRNPRVKKREQYRKALIRRKGAVREVRAPEEGYHYGGESTGVKTNLSKSRKL